MGEVNINNVSKRIQNAVNNILNSDGIRGISCENEYNQLAGLLAGTKDKNDSGFIEGFMLEWQDRKEAENTNKKTEENKVPEEEIRNTEPEKGEPVPEEPVDVGPTEPKIPTPVDPKPPVDKKPPTEEKPPVDKKHPTTPTPQKTVINNDNDINQGGLGNINAGPGATVIVNNGPPVIINDTPVNDIGKPGIVPPKDGFEGPNRSVLRDLSPREIKDARDSGKAVAEMLFGYTSNYDQKHIQDIIEKRVNPDNVIEFIRGFEEQLKDKKDPNLLGLALGGLVGAGAIAANQTADHFFEQMVTEWDFPEKQEMMRKVAKDLQAHMEAKYGMYMTQEEATEIPVILLERTLGEREAQKLDRIAIRETNRPHS